MKVRYHLRRSDQLPLHFVSDPSAVPAPAYDLSNQQQQHGQPQQMNYQEYVHLTRFRRLDNANSRESLMDQDGGMYG